MRTLNARCTGTNSYELLSDGQPTEAELAETSRRWHPAPNSRAPVELARLVGIEVRTIQPADRSPAVFLTTWRVLPLAG